MADPSLKTRLIKKLAEVPQGQTDFYLYTVGDIRCHRTLLNTTFRRRNYSLVILLYIPFFESDHRPFCSSDVFIANSSHDDEGSNFQGKRKESPKLQDFLSHSAW